MPISQINLPNHQAALSLIRGSITQESMILSPDHELTTPESKHLENTIDIIVFLPKGLSQGPISIIFKSPAAKSHIFP